MKYASLIFVVAVLVVGTPLAQQTETSSPVLVSLPKVSMPKDGYGSGGTVMVRVSVNESGEVTDAEFAKGPGSVCSGVERPDVIVTRGRAVELARQAKFTPAMSGGIPVASSALVAIEFVPSTGQEAKMKTKPTTLTVIGSSDTPSNMALPASASSKPDEAITKDINTISGGVLNGTAMSLPNPSYPAAARAVRASGAVHVQVLIDVDGSVFSAAPTGGHPLLQSASVTAACNAKFTPTLLAGQPVKVSGIITYNFVP